MELVLWISVSVCILAFTAVKIAEKILYLKHPEKYPLSKRNKDDVKEV